MQTEFTIETRGQGLYEFTRDIADWVASEGADDALLTLFVRHTSCSLLIQENADPDVRTDLLAWLTRLVPPLWATNKFPMSCSAITIYPFG